MSAADALGYFLGQCTDFVASTVSWVRSGWGNAGQWYGNAGAQGFSEGQTPQVGAVAVWSAALPGSGGAGHVADVTGVNPNGSFTVQEENYSGGPGVVDTRSVPAGGGGDFLGFIYGPAGTTTPAQLMSSSGGNPVSDVAGALTTAVSNGVNGALDNMVSSALGGLSSAAGAAGQDVGTFANNNLIAIGAAAAVTAVLLWRFQVDQ